LRDSIIRSVEVALLPEIACMARFMGGSQHLKSLMEIRDEFTALLESIDCLIKDGVIEPWHPLRLSESDVLPQESERPLRVGIFPIRANPIFWGHILCGLEAIRSAELDKIVYTVVFRKGEPPFMPEELRSGVARDVLKIFDPLLCCSDAGRGARLDEESGLLRVRELNRDRNIDAFRISDFERDGTIRFEIRALESGRDRDHAGFVTPPPIRVIPAALPDASPQELRTLAGNRHTDVIPALPFVVLKNAREAAMDVGNDAFLEHKKVEHSQKVEKPSSSIRAR
jgi:hypothetical protein